MSIQVMSKVWADQTITDQTELLVLLAIADYANSDGDAWPGIDSIASKSRLVPRSVFRVIDRLKKAGKLEVTSGGGISTNHYKITHVPVVVLTPDLKTPHVPKTLTYGQGTPDFGVPSKSPDPSGTISEPKKKGGGSASPPSSEHQAFIQGWHQNFKAQFGFEYSFASGRDGKAVQLLLGLKILRIDLLEIAKKAWQRGGQPPKSFNCEQASTIHGFQNYFNQIQVELKNGNTHHKSNRRLDGVARGVVDYGQAAQRKVERQMAEAANPKPSPA